MKTPFASHRCAFGIGLFCLLGMLFSLLPGCGGGGGGGGGNPVGPGATTSYGTISGSVRFDGQPAAGIGVFLVQPVKAIDSGISGLQPSLLKAGSVRSSIVPDAGYGDYRTTTGPDGSYRFDQVVSGEYTLVAVKDANHQYVKTNLLVGISAAVTVQDVQLTPTGSLSGTVLALGAADQSGTLVYLDGTSYVALTDGTGKFTILNAASGTYVLRTQRSGFIGTSAPATVVPAQTVTVAPQSLPALTGPVAGVGNAIGTATRSPFAAGDFDHAGLMVHLIGTPYVTFTDSLGSYRFTGVPTGTYQLGFPSERYIYSGTLPTVTVAAGQTTAVSAAVTLAPRIFTQPTGAFSGTVTKSPVLGDESDNSGVMVQIQNASGSYLTTTNGAGAFGFNNLPYGTYTVVFPAGRYKFLSGLVAITISAAPVTQAYVVTPIQLPAQLGSFTGTLSKTLLLPGDTDESGVIVQVKNATGSYFATSDAAGAFAFGALPYGSYAVSFPPGRYKHLSGPLTVTISGTTANGAYTVAPIQLPAQVGSFTGTVTKSPRLADEADQSGVIVQVQNASGTTYFTTTDAVGSFSFTGLPLNTYAVSFPPGRYKVLSGPSNVTVTTGGVTGNYTVTPIQTAAGPTGTLSGTISKTVKIDGASETHALAIKIASATQSFTTVADSTGFFEFKGIPVGTYSFQIADSLYGLDSSFPGFPSTNVVVNVGPNNLGTILVNPLVTYYGVVTGSFAGALPSEGSEIVLRKQGEANSVFITKIAGNGTFVFWDVPAGTYSLRLRPETHNGAQLTDVHTASFTVTNFQTIDRSGLVAYRPTISTFGWSGTTLILTGTNFHSAATVTVNDSTSLSIIGVSSTSITVDGSSVPTKRSSVKVENPDRAYASINVLKDLPAVNAANFFAVGVTDTRLGLVWPAVTGATEYQITYSPTGGNPSSPFTVTTTAATITGLLATTSYSVTIEPRAVLADGTLVNGATTNKSFATRQEGMTPSTFLVDTGFAKGIITDTRLAGYDGKAFLLFHYPGGHRFNSFSALDANLGTGLATETSSMVGLNISAGPRLFVYSSNSATEHSISTLAASGSAQSFTPMGPGIAMAQSTNSKVYVAYANSPGQMELVTYGPSFGAGSENTVSTGTPAYFNSAYLAVSKDNTRVALYGAPSSAGSTYLTTNLAGTASFTPMQAITMSNTALQSLAPDLNDFLPFLRIGSATISITRRSKATGYDSPVPPSTIGSLGNYGPIQMVFDGKRRAWLYDGNNLLIRRYEAGQFAEYKEYSIGPASNYTALDAGPNVPAITFDPVTNKIITGFRRTDQATEFFEILSFDASLD